ncbi:MAG: leucine--tRNA ligase [Saprospiraceae bacterium]|nr:leucine--tRNA ligase [Saprospiraceae bacterium]
MDYKPRDIEIKWRKYWEENGVYKVDNQSDKPKYYVLDMFPYPSGAGLHVGHPLGYIASDIYARYKTLKGFNVLHPMGFDAFGLPAEEYALQTGIHPAVSTNENMARYREQLSNLGFSFDWSREVYTCDPKYYKWTQWIFTMLFDHYFDQSSNSAKPISDLEARFAAEGNATIKAATTQEENFSAADWQAFSRKEKAEILMNYRLAYRKIGYVNWCEELGTVLANDQVKDGVSERGGYPVIQKAMTQWYLRITAYADRLLYDLDEIDWSDALKTMQRNWIGRSEGASIHFDVVGSDEKIEVFTTRPDTIFGATYMVLAPEHDLVAKLTTPEQQQAVDDYLSYVNARSEIERMAEKKVTGAFIGAYATNPFTNTQIPIWIGEYVLKDYGTGAIMAVPSDDERDKTFATKFELPIIDVVDKSKYPGATLHDKVGVIINSGFMNGMEVPEAITAASAKVEEMGIGKARVNYKMRDANFSRQRYWGEPFPVKYDSEDIAHMISVEDLPLELPDTDDFKPGKGGQSPLSRLQDWVNAEEGFVRETDTMPAVAGSSWYYLRYMDPNNDSAFVSQDAVNYWESVDLYVGGSEHAVAHLMYARFWHKFLHDKGLLPTNEPFKKLINQGMIQGVIEFIFLEKGAEGDQKRFVPADMAAAETDKEFAKIPVHVDFVSNYGSPKSYLSTAGIDQFIEWRPEYSDAIFESESGTYQKGAVSLKDGAEELVMTTLSEVGKMSKSKFNVINPDQVIDRYGTDCFRMYEMFLGPIEQSKPWDTKGIDGVSRFLRKFWALFFDQQGNFQLSDETPSKEELKSLHTAIKKVNEDIERFNFNTCISAFMVASNELSKLKCNKREILEPLIILLAPFGPHIAEELWHLAGREGSVHHATYPVFDEAHLVEDSVTYPIAINGKTRATAEFPADASREELEKAAVDVEGIQKYTEGKTIRKIIVVPGRMINIVV